jgi:tetratricopeptide (TPR) repeat protein
MNGAIAYLLRGFLYEKTGKYKDAISDYSKVLLIDPKNKAAGLCRKRILLRGYAAFTKAGLAAFDSGVNAYNNRDGLSAKKELGKALVLFANASRLDTGGKTAPGMTNFAKGLIYQISARENLDATKPADSRYAKAAQMRRAYHPLAVANAYYERAGQYLKDKKLTSLLKDYKTVNDRDLIMARGRFPNLEYGSSKYMRAVETEANCIVNFDIAGESLAAGNHNEAKRVLSKNESMASDLKRLKSPNADGIGRLARAYSRLDTILSYPLRDTAWMKANRATIEKEISACVDELGAAKSGLVDVALLNTCSKLLKNLSAIQAMVEKAGT